MDFADIKTRTYFLTGTDSSSYPDAQLTISTQRAMERVCALANKNWSGWQWDDTNQSDLPSATLTLTSGQQQYSLATSFLTIDRIEIKDDKGNWIKLKQIDQQGFKNGWLNFQLALATGETTPSTGRTGAYQATPGIPTEYDVSGSNIFFFPVPNYTVTAGIRIYFTRAPLQFDYTTGKFTDATGSTSSVPGFASIFHDLIPLWASYDYGMKAMKQNTPLLLAEIQRKEAELMSFYARRDRDIKNFMEPSRVLYI